MGKRKASSTEVTLLQAVYFYLCRNKVHAAEQLVCKHRVASDEESDLRPLKEGLAEAKKCLRKVDQKIESNKAAEDMLREFKDIVLAPTNADGTIPVKLGEFMSQYSKHDVDTVEGKFTICQAVMKHLHAYDGNLAPVNRLLRLHKEKAQREQVHAQDVVQRKIAALKQVQDRIKAAQRKASQVTKAEALVSEFKQIPITMEKCQYAQEMYVRLLMQFHKTHADLKTTYDPKTHSVV